VSFFIGEDGEPLALTASRKQAKRQGKVTRGLPPSVARMFNISPSPPIKKPPIKGGFFIGEKEKI
jgi:hypothetical protein